MNRRFFAMAAALLTIVCTTHAQSPVGHEAMGGMKHEAGVPSKTLTLTGLDGESRTLTLDDLQAMSQTTVTVTNGHSHQQETYSGVPVKALLALVSTKPAEGAPKISPRMTVVVAGATDNFHVVLTLCDTEPGCRSGQAIVADMEDGKPLAADGAFKLILTEDKMPGRWVRNLNSLTEKAISAN